MTGVDAGLRPPTSTKILVAWTAVAAVGIAAVGTVLNRYDPRTVPWFPACPFHAVTGWYCPGCGTTRALHELMHARIGAALAFNPLLLFAPVLLLLFIKRASWFYRSSSPFVFLAIVLVFGFLRNIPVWPLSMLAPH
jgi:hypothetical protein